MPAKSKLEEYVKLGLVRAQTHPSLPLSIYVYTEFTQYEKLWNSVTMECRGLVVDESGRPIVRCMPKFFNEDEPHAFFGMTEAEIKLTTPIYFDKLDGSLIQIVNDKEYGLIITSKGSFESDQAKWATQIFQQYYTLDDLDSDKTYIFELIHPDNRIVLDYGDRKELILLAVNETETGADLDIYTNKFNKFTRAPIITDVENHMDKLVEGVVVKQRNHRIKIKTGEYVRLHRIVTDFTPKRVWESLMNDDSLEFENMPEEFESWLNNTVKELTDKFNNIVRDVWVEHDSVADSSDKDIGLSTHLKYKGLVFMLRNGKDIAQTVWKMVKPKKESNESIN